MHLKCVLCVFICIVYSFSSVSSGGGDIKKENNIVQTMGERIKDVHTQKLVQRSCRFRCSSPDLLSHFLWFFVSFMSLIQMANGWLQCEGAEYTLYIVIIYSISCAFCGIIFFFLAYAMPATATRIYRVIFECCFSELPISRPQYVCGVRDAIY